MGVVGVGVGVAVVGVVVGVDVGVDVVVVAAAAAAAAVVVVADQPAAVADQPAAVADQPADVDRPQAEDAVDVQSVAAAAENWHMPNANAKLNSSVTYGAYIAKLQWITVYRIPKIICRVLNTDTYFTVTTRAT